MDAMTRARYEGDLRQYQQDKATAVERGVSVEAIRAERTATKPDGFFDKREVRA